MSSFVFSALSSLLPFTAFANASKSFTVESPPPAEVARIGSVSVFGVQLPSDPHTAEELRDGSYLPVGDHITPMYVGGVRNGAATIEGMRPGAHTLCAMVGDPRIASTVQLECTQLMLTASPNQTASLVVPAAWAETP
ncbi:MAG: hypothetical protein ABJE66_09460 [Deltaproteobacteria bacterium]